MCICTVYAQNNTASQLQEGLINLQNQNYEGAVNIFQNILRVEPKNEQAGRGLAIALIGLDKFAEASREIAKLLARSPQDANLLEMAARSFWQQKRFAETEIVLKRRLALGDEKAELWAMFADALDAQKKTAEAVNAYQNAIRISPDSVNYRYALGALYWKLFRFEDAEREFLFILQKNPAEPRASFNLGDIYLSRGEAAKAVPLLETAAKAFPGEYDTRLALGRAYFSVQKYAAAIVELQAAVKLRPEIPEGFYQLGLALQRSGKPEDAKAFFKKAKELQNQKLASEKINTDNR